MYITLETSLYYLHTRDQFISGENSTTFMKEKKDIFFFLCKQPFLTEYVTVFIFSKSLLYALHTCKSLQTNWKYCIYVAKKTVTAGWKKKEVQRLFWQCWCSFTAAIHQQPSSDSINNKCLLLDATTNVCVFSFSIVFWQIGRIDGTERKKEGRRCHKFARSKGCS